jgi:hypothetical protein
MATSEGRAGEDDAFSDGDRLGTKLHELERYGLYICSEDYVPDGNEVANRMWYVEPSIWEQPAHVDTQPLGPLEALEALAEASNAFNWRLDGPVVTIADSRCAELAGYPLDTRHETIAFRGTWQDVENAAASLIGEDLCPARWRRRPRGGNTIGPLFWVEMRDTSLREFLSQVTVLTCARWRTVYFEKDETYAVILSTRGSDPWNRWGITGTWECIDQIRWSGGLKPGNASSDRVVGVAKSWLLALAFTVGGVLAGRLLAGLLLRGRCCAGRAILSAAMVLGVAAGDHVLAGQRSSGSGREDGQSDAGKSANARVLGEALARLAERRIVVCYEEYQPAGSSLSAWHSQPAIWSIPVAIDTSELSLQETLEALSQATGAFVWRRLGGVVVIIDKRCTEVDGYALDGIRERVRFRGNWRDFEAFAKRVIGEWRCPPPVVPTRGE